MSSQWKPADEQSWSMTKKSIQEDGPTGAKFLVFLNFWLNCAEQMLADNAAQLTFADDHRQPPATTELTVPNAVRQALELAEARLGFVDVWFMGQLLVVMCSYWQHGDALAQGMSVIELKLTGQALAYKLHELQELAAVEQDGESDE